MLAIIRKHNPTPEQIASSLKPSQFCIESFYDFWRECNRTKARKLFKVLKGGRNSSKSSHISLRIINDLQTMPVNALVVRKVGNTLAESVYEQLLWAIDMLGANNLWEAKKNPLRLIYKPRGNMIIFRGADNPLKIKSIKTSKFPIAILWIEELAEFKTEDEVSVIVNSILRAELPPGLKYDIYYSYNPPKRKSSWVNKKYETHMLPKNVYVHHSDYRTNPFVSQEFKEEAEAVKAKNEYKYRWEYLGEPIGSGIVPFENLSFRKITNDEIAVFDNIRQGLDWGYGIDPVCFGHGHLDTMRRKLFIFDEIYGQKISNRKLAEKIKAKGYQDYLTIADSAEPKSINELNERGVWTIGAKKGAGSVEYGEKWLDDLDEIIIDPERCPNTAREFENIDYEVDAFGNTLNQLVGIDNHSIDCWRYGCENDMKTGNKIGAGQTDN